MKLQTTKNIGTFLVAALILTAAPGFSQSTTGLSGSLESSRQTRFYKDPSKALLLSLFPGVLIHGYGHLYAKDRLAGTALIAGEVISLAAIGLGAAAREDAEHFTGGIFGGNEATVMRTGRRMIIYGAMGFGVTWFVDLLHSPTAAKEYNDRYNLQPIASMGGNPTLAFAVRF